MLKNHRSLDKDRRFRVMPPVSDRWFLTFLDHKINRRKEDARLIQISLCSICSTLRLRHQGNARVSAHKVSQELFDLVCLLRNKNNNMAIANSFNSKTTK